MYGIPIIIPRIFFLGMDVKGQNAVVLGRSKIVVSEDFIQCCMHLRRAVYTQVTKREIEVMRNWVGLKMSPMRLC